MCRVISKMRQGYIIMHPMQHAHQNKTVKTVLKTNKGVGASAAALIDYPHHVFLLAGENLIFSINKILFRSLCTSRFITHGEVFESQHSLSFAKPQPSCGTGLLFAVGDPHPTFRPIPTTENLRICDRKGTQHATSRRKCF